MSEYAGAGQSGKHVVTTPDGSTPEGSTPDATGPDATGPDAAGPDGASAEGSLRPGGAHPGTERNPVTREVAAPPEQVFAVLAQGWLYPTWVVGAARMRDVDGHWPAQGSKLHHSFGSWPVMIDDETEVLRSEAPRRLVLQARGWPAGEATVDIRIEPLAGGRSRVTLAEDASAGPGRFVPGPLRSAAITFRNRETLRRLAFIAEGQSSAPDPSAGI